MSAPPVRSPARGLLDDALGSLGKAVAAAAGAGLFLYLIGTAVLWQRVESIGLEAQEVVAVIPRDQLAVGGAREVLVSLVAGVIFAYFLYGCHSLYVAAERFVDAGGIRGRSARWMRERPALVITATVAIVTAPAVPFNESSAVFEVAFLANLFLGVRSAHRSLIGELPRFHVSLRPWLRVVAGWSIAVFLVSVWRPSEFPEPFPIADVCLVAKPHEAPAADCESVSHKQCDRYVGLTSDAVILARPRLCEDEATNEAVVVARDEIEQIKLRTGTLERPARSLLQRIDVQLSCIAPVCQVGGKRWNLLRPFDPETTADK